LDFYLFGNRKSHLNRQSIPDIIGLLEIVADFLDGTSVEGLRAVFCHWIKRVQNAIDANEGYVFWQTF
jgi:hypothetical protein